MEPPIQEIKGLSAEDMKTQHKPLSQVRKTFRVKWYRSPIDRGKLQKLMQRCNLRGTFQAVGHLALWTATGLLSYYFYTQQWWVWFGVALFLHGTVGSFFRGVAPHELGHGTVFKTKWLNRFFLYIYSILGWWNFHEYAISHTYHHRYTLHPEGDREVVLPRNPMLRFLNILQLFTVNITFKTEANAITVVVKRLLWTVFNRHTDNWIKAIYEEQDEARREAVNWARLVLAFHVIVIGVSIGIGKPVIAVLISGQLFIGNWLKCFVGLPMHCGLRDNVPDFRMCVRSITLDPISQFLYWYMNWHTEHHMFAGVPCYNLAKLHELVKDDMPRTRTMIGAWSEMRETWRHQQKDPDYQFDTPLPPTAHPAVSHHAIETTDEDSLEASIGDLAPKSIA